MDLLVIYASANRGGPHSISHTFHRCVYLRQMIEYFLLDKLVFGHHSAASHSGCGHHKFGKRGLMLLQLDNATGRWPFCMLLRQEVLYDEQALFSRWYNSQVMSTGKNQDMKNFLVRIYKNYCPPRRVSFVDLAPYSLKC